MKHLRGIAALALGAAVAAGVPVAGAKAAPQFVIGVSNTHIGNSWREEFVCSIKAEALASGLVSKIVLANREAGPSEQIADLRTLISAGVNAIIINPSDGKALDPVIKQAAAKGIIVIAADQPVEAPEAYVVTGDQQAYAHTGAEWLFKQLKCKGNIVEMRGIDGVPADADRHEGFTEALKAYTDIKVTSSVFTGLSETIASQSATHSSQMKIDPGPAISFFTSYCDFRQNEQCSGALSAYCGGRGSAVLVSAMARLRVRVILTVRYRLTAGASRCT